MSQLGQPFLQYRIAAFTDCHEDPPQFSEFIFELEDALGGSLSGALEFLILFAGLEQIEF